MEPKVKAAIRAAGATPLDYQVRIKAIRFDRETGGDSVLDVRWSILSGDGGQELLSRASRYAVAPQSNDDEATVAAMNETLALFSRDIVAALRAAPRFRRTP